MADLRCVEDVMSCSIVVRRDVVPLLAAGLLWFVACADGQEALTGPEPENPAPVAVLPAGAPASFVFVPPVCDDAGPDDEPAQSDVACFTRADDIADHLGVRWSWDNTNVWTGSGQTGDGCGLIDTDGDGMANLAACARFTNDPTGTMVLQLPSAGTAVVYSCGDNKADRCSQPVTSVAVASTTCQVALDDTFSEPQQPWGPGENAPFDVVATCDLDLTELPSALDSELLNVCTFPSGQPNSNPFDCVVTPGAGYLVIEKETSPGTTDDFDFTLSPAATTGQSAFAVPGGDGSGGAGSSGLVPVAPGTSYSVTETVPGGWSLLTASCTGTGTFNGTNAVSGIEVASGQTVTCTFENSQPPSITVSKTPTPGSLPETGGSVQFDVVVENTSGAAVTLNTLVDDVFGDITDGSNAAIDGTTCSVPQALAASGDEGDSYSCHFTATLSGAAGGTHRDTVTAGANNAAGSAEAMDGAEVMFSDELPSISVAKTPAPTSVPETGADVTFTVLVTNHSAEAVELTALVDDVFGNLNGKGSCVVPQNLAASGQASDDYSCSFVEMISGVPGVDHADTVTATAKDDDDNETTADGGATVTITAVAPTLTLTKTADPTSVLETGGSVSYLVEIDNTSAETITLASLDDDVFGDLAGKGTCDVPQILQPDGQPGDSYSCSFSEMISGNAGQMHVNEATVDGADDDGQPVTGADTAAVTFTDVLPDITVTKTASPTTLQAGDVDPVPPGPGAGGGPFFLDPVCDDAGPNDEPAQSDLNCFTRADNVPGVLSTKWWWDDTDVWTGSGQTGDACALFSTDADEFADFVICARFTNDATGTQVIQLPSSGVATAWTCSDKKADRCSQQIAPLTSLGTTECTVALGTEPDSKPWNGDDYPADVVATCDLDLAALPGGASARLLNVCSYPSGSPNSNPFDCVVTPGAGYLVIEKATNPSSGQGFDFTVSPAPLGGGGSTFTVGGDDDSGGPGSSALIAVAPGSYSITETAVDNWTLMSASCDDGSGTFNGTNAVSGVAVSAGETVTCTFTNDWSLTGDVTYTIEVTNNSAEAATLTSLTDDRFGNLHGKGSCSLTQALAPTGEAGYQYTCSFTESLTGDAGDVHTNVVTAEAGDDDGNTDVDTDDATVTFVGP
jgi:hypothetical protein